MNLFQTQRMFRLIAVRNGVFGELPNEWISLVTVAVRGISLSVPLPFKLTPYLMGEPLKKKKKIDPMILKMRQERKTRKIEKEIRKLEKLDKVSKPIEENRLPISLFYEKEIRKRAVDIPQSVLEERFTVLKELSRLGKLNALQDTNTIRKIILSQQAALQELRMESEELYSAAIQIDENLIPFSHNGPVETPPIVGYNPPDGDYIDISRDWTKE